MTKFVVNNFSEDDEKSSNFTIPFNLEDNDTSLNSL